MICPPSGNYLLTGREKGQEGACHKDNFLFVLPLTSDNWRFKKAPGDIFGPMFASIN